MNACIDPAVTRYKDLADDAREDFRKTLAAYRNHGQPEPRLKRGMQATGRSLGRLAEVGIDLEAVTQRLEKEGVAKFNQAFDKLLEALELARAAAAMPTPEQASASSGTRSSSRT